MKLLKKSYAGIVLLLAGFTTAHASGDIEHADTTTQLSSMSAEQKKQDQDYFAAHSFEFSSIFKRHHPGPYWILEKTKEFQLSSAQIKQQEQLKFGMAKSTIAGNTALKQAYEKYATDAAAIAPSLAVIHQDIEAIGKAQTHLAQVMVPYHLKAYAALNPTQQALYRKWVACVGAACAQPDKAPMPPSNGATLEQRFQRLDADGDGFVTWEGAMPSRVSDFMNMDSNKDNAVTPAEYKAALPFGAFDRNTDGAISKAEFLATHRAMFMKFDADADQRISLSEFVTAQRAAGK